MQHVNTRESVAHFFHVDSDHVALTEFDGGFTNTKKYIIDVKNSHDIQKKYFIKTANINSHPLEAFLLESEAKMYQIFKKLGLTGFITPNFEGLIQNGTDNILVLDFLSHVSFGYPWNSQTIEYLDKSLHSLHSVVLTEIDKTQIMTLSNLVRRNLTQNSKQIDEKTLFMNAWKRECRYFNHALNSGENAENNLPHQIIQRASRYNLNSSVKLTLQDLNPTNIGFSATQAYLIDPVYATLGNPSLDRTIAGINILYKLNNSADMRLKRSVVGRFIGDDSVLATIIKTHVINLIMHPDANNREWQKYHRDCIAIALKLICRPWHEKLFFHY